MISECEHDFTLSTSQIKSLTFWVKFQIKNVGDRGTSIYNIGLFFRSDGKEYQWEKKYFRGPTIATVDNEKRWLEVHKVLDIRADFYDTYEGTDKEQIDCTFTIYHTHSSEKMKTVSHRRKEGKTTQVYA
jgi:hypothetical protein